MDSSNSSKNKSSDFEDSNEKENFYKKETSINKNMEQTNIVHNEDINEHQNTESNRQVAQSVKDENEDQFSGGEEGKIQIQNEDDFDNDIKVSQEKLELNNDSISESDNSNEDDILNKNTQNKRKKNKSLSSSDGSDGEQNSQISQLKIPKIDQNDEDILQFYEYLRKHHNSQNPWEDPEFARDILLFGKNGELSEKFIEKDYQIDFERPPDADVEDIHFFSAEKSTNIEYEFKVKRGILSDKFFLGAVMMLFRRKEQFFSNLVLDYDHVDENIRAGFCGFTFFINGEWRNVTVDTFLPWHQEDEMALSIATSNKTSFWLCLLQKAYAKVHKSYDVINDVSVKNTLVDITGGISKKITLKEKMDDTEKKSLFDEIKRCIIHKYLIGCMRFDPTEDDPDDSRSDQGEEEEILPNCIYNILDLQEVDGYRLIYLVNYWNRGKWSKDFGPDDDAWESNKALKDKLEYDALQDGTFWMRFEDWMLQFNTVYYCRIFPESWSQFCISGEWNGITSGGAPPKNTGMPWIPERVSDDKNINIAKTMTKTMTKNSIVSPNVKDLSSVMSSKKRNQVSGAFKFNHLPAVDEDGEDNLKDDEQGNKISISQTHTKDNIMQTNSNLKKFAPTNTKTNTMMSKNTLSNLNTSNVSNFKVSNLPNKSQYKENEDHKHHKELIKRVIIQDTEDRWFLNPQYKLEIKPNTRLIISLLQEDERLSRIPYQKCNFMIILCKGKYSHVWDLKEENLIKKANEEDRKVSREILVHLDYQEIMKKISPKKRKKMLSKSEKIHVNVIPYLEYHQKYEVEKMGNMRTFKQVNKEGTFWLRIFSSEEIYISELAKPYERSMEYEWTSESAGGARYIKDLNKNKIVENSDWPLNPQYLLKFDNNISMKIILRKTTGRFGEEEKVGLILTKPNFEENLSSVLKKEIKNTKHSFNKNDQILRVLESTNKILESKKINYEDIDKKMSLNSSEWVRESSYSNNYCASLYMNYNKIDSPVMLIPTLDTRETAFGYKLSIFSNRPVELYSLNHEDSKVIISEWKESNAGGCHLTQDEKIKKKDEEYTKKKITWYDNPKFQISFDYKDRLPEVEFEIIISRPESAWKKKIANSFVNSMIGIYVFKYDKDKWKDLCINRDKVDFVPKSEISYKFADAKVDPKGYIIMPATYGSNVFSPFVMMVKCKHKFSITPFVQKKIME